MAQLYADEHYPLPVLEFLRALGHDVLTVQEAFFLKPHRMNRGAGGGARGGPPPLETIQKVDFSCPKINSYNHFSDRFLIWRIFI